MFNHRYMRYKMLGIFLFWQPPASLFAQDTLHHKAAIKGYVVNNEGAAVKKGKVYSNSNSAENKKLLFEIDSTGYFYFEPDTAFRGKPAIDCYLELAERNLTYKFELPYDSLSFLRVILKNIEKVHYKQVLFEVEAIHEAIVEKEKVVYVEKRKDASPTVEKTEHNSSDSEYSEEVWETDKNKNTYERVQGNLEDLSNKINSDKQYIRRRYKEIEERLRKITEEISNAGDLLPYQRQLLVKQIEELERQIRESRTNFDDLEKNLENQLEQIKQLLLEKSEALEFSENARNFSIVISINLGLLALILFGLYRKLNKKNKLILAQKNELDEQKKILQIQYKKITESISTALTIQNAILPDKDDLLNLQDYFILFKPKDIVSGDFYWVNTIGDRKMFALADCTGHGVPGALMTMLSYALLNELVSDRGLVDPGEILEELDLGINKLLRQKEGQLNEGLDICLCILEGDTLQYASSKHDIFLVLSGQMIHRRGQNRSIGGLFSSQIKNKFETIYEKVSKGDLVYLLTDGVIDNPNPKRQKFGRRRVTELIQRNHENDLVAQEEIFHKAILDFQEEADQRDDMTLMVVRV